MFNFLLPLNYLTKSDRMTIKPVSCISCTRRALQVRFWFTLTSHIQRSICHLCFRLLLRGSKVPIGNRNGCHINQFTTLEHTLKNFKKTQMHSAVTDKRRRVALRRGRVGYRGEIREVGRELTGCVTLWGSRVGGDDGTRSGGRLEGMEDR